MKQPLHLLFRTIALSLLLMIPQLRSYASHILGAELTYANVSGETYKITFIIYGDCSPAFSTGFSTFPTSSPQICIYDGSTYNSTLGLTIQPPTTGIEVTSLCAGDTSQCTNPASTLPGVMKFVYSSTITLPHTSAVWRFIYTGDNGTGTAAGRSASITNLSGAGGTIMQLVDTLNNSGVAGNNSAVFNVFPPLYYHINQFESYDPLAIDTDADSLQFSLVAPTNGTSGAGSAGACSPGGSVTYIPASAWPGTPISASTPLEVAAGSFYLNDANGQLSFYPDALQKADVVYSVREFRGGIFVGSTQHELIFNVASSSLSAPCTGIPDAGTVSTSFNCTGNYYTLSLSDYSCAGVTFQWQASTDSAVWSNIAGANLPTFVIAPTASLYYRCVVTCTSSGMIAYSGSVFIRGGLGFNSAIINNPDTTCNEPKFYISVCIFSPSYKVVSYYGDGTSDTTHLTDTAICQAEFYHNYTTSGTYFIKQVLYDSSEAVDSVSFSYQYLYCRFLPLKFYSDLNHNCVFDSGDIYNMLPINVEVDSNHIPIDTISVTTGVYYKTNGGVGTIYSFRVLSSELYVSCPGSGIVYDTIQSYINNYAIKNIGLSCVTGTAYDLGISASLLCGVHMAVGDIVVFNSYCEAENAIVSMPINPKYRFSSSSPAPTSVVGNTATWDFSLLSAASLESVIHFSLTIPTSAYLTIGDTVQSSYAVTPVTSDVNPANNNCVILDTVKGSFDPNEMSVTPSGYISAGTQLKYTILFENTGNDTAHDIYVMDTLSDNVDLHSLKLLAATAAMNIAAFNDGAHNIVKFDFPGINLLDSTHHNLCDGMVMVNINAKPGLPDGTLIFNHAGIFFDDNPVVMTDTVEDIIGSPILGTTVISNNEVELFPNPTTSELVIKMQQGAYSSCTITNAIGQVDLQQQISVAQTKMNVKMLPAGVYYIILRGNNGSKMLKFVKE